MMKLKTSKIGSGYPIEAISITDEIVDKEFSNFHQWTSSTGLTALIVSTLHKYFIISISLTITNILHYYSSIESNTCSIRYKVSIFSLDLVVNSVVLLELKR